MVAAGCGGRAVAPPPGGTAYVINDGRGESVIAVDATAKKSYFLQGQGAWVQSAEAAAPRPAAKKPLPEAAAPAVQSAAPAAAPPPSADERARAQVALLQARGQLGRLKSSGFAALVADDLAAIAASLDSADAKLAAGDAAGAGLLADEARSRLELARAKIEADTKSPVRW